MLAQGTELIVIAIGVVWGASELTARSRARAERRSAAGRYLARLLDVRHRLVCYRKITEEFSAHSFEDQASLQAMLKGTLPQYDEVNRTFEESTAILAETDPFFAFRLRMNQWQIPAVVRLGGIASADSAVDGPWAPIEKPFIKHVQDGIDELILTLAHRHGSGTWADVQEYLNHPPEMPEGMKQILQKVEERLKAGSRERVA